MFIVMDYGDRKCPGFDEGDYPDFTAADIKVANYQGEDFLFMGYWKPLMERRGFPEEEGKNVLDKLYGKIKEAGEKAIYVCLGQMTTLGCLMMTHPDAASYLETVLVCPGEQNKDKDYPVSEEHVLKDPEAARIVMKGSMPKAIIAEKTLLAQYKTVDRCLADWEGWKKDAHMVYATVILDKSCTFGSLYIDKLDICKREPNTMLIGGFYNGKDTGNH